MRQLLHNEIKNQKPNAQLSILANNMHSPFNVGSLFRLADNLGIEKLYFSGNSVYPPNRKIAKTSRATEQYVNFEYVENPVEIIKKLKREDYKIISVEYCDKSKEIEQLSLHKDEKILLILGEENRGVADELLKLSDEVFHINMYGKTTSMNVINACTIVSYEILKQIKP
ncbi:MAG: TrmH family RNA methyltransferase [Bacteroidetes bacterium]|nr:TrmH family RNA methyltransferase [Bacteroidota bacterium]MCB9227138.1 TrmH family RNA methyltransferase [Chitinophagales bacterium]